MYTDKVTSIRECIYNKIAEVLMIDKSFISDTSKFKEDLGADSLDMISLLMEFEDLFTDREFGEEFDQVKTVS